ncbi:MAG: hypothetical protein EOP54_29355, partial [Sphingobacteriales bacterium]
MRNLLLAFFLLLFAGVVSTSCNKLYDDTIHRNTLEAIKLDSTSLHMFVGEKRQIPLTTTPSTYSLDSLNWISSDTAVLSITDMGLITAKSAGTSTVTISNLDSTLSATVLVNVTDEPVDSLQVGLIAYYPFNNSAADSSGNNYNGTTFDVLPTTDRHGNSDAAYQFNGTNQYISTTTAYPAANLNNFTYNFWFKTTTTTGGRMVGFGNAQTGQSGNYDRHVYMSANGRVNFGVYNGATQVISTSEGYNDNAWHNVVATLSPSGMRLYVDGALQGTLPAVTIGESYTGYFKIAYDNVNSWPNQPSNFYFDGVLD